MPELVVLLQSKMYGVLPWHIKLTTNVHLHEACCSFFCSSASSRSFSTNFRKNAVSKFSFPLRFFTFSAVPLSISKVFCNCFMKSTQDANDFTNWSTRQQESGKFLCFSGCKSYSRAILFFPVDYLCWLQQLSHKFTLLYRNCFGRWFRFQFVNVQIFWEGLFFFLFFCKYDAHCLSLFLGYIKNIASCPCIAEKLCSFMW